MLIHDCKLFKLDLFHWYSDKINIDSLNVNSKTNIHTHTRQKTRRLLNTMSKIIYSKNRSQQEYNLHNNEIRYFSLLIIHILTKKINNENKTKN